MDATATWDETLGILELRDCETLQHSKPTDEPVLGCFSWTHRTVPAIDQALVLPLWSSPGPGGFLTCVDHL